MYRPNRSTVIGVAAAAAAVTGAVVLARTAVTDRPPAHHDQVELIEQPKTDPFFATAPHDGQLVQEQCAPAGCDDAAVAEYLEGGSVSVMRLYRTPAAYSLDQLRQRFDQPAAAGGWRLDFTDSYSQRSYTMAKVIYCREIGREVRYASVYSSNVLSDNPDPQAQPVVGVQVVMSNGPAGSICGIENRTNEPDITDDGPAGATNGQVAR